MPGRSKRRRVHAPTSVDRVLSGESYTFGAQSVAFARQRSVNVPPVTTSYSCTAPTKGHMTHVFPPLGTRRALAELDVGKIAIHEGTPLRAKRIVAGLDSSGLGPVNVLASDHEVNRATERVGYLPGGRQRDAAVGTVAGTLVAGVGGRGNAERFCEVLGRTVTRFAAEPLQCSFATNGVPRGVNGGEG